MDIETAANLGEMLSGLAILFTLIFGARQIKQWNETVKINSARDVANHISSSYCNPTTSLDIILLESHISRFPQTTVLVACIFDTRDRAWGQGPSTLPRGHLCHLCSNI